LKENMAGGQQFQHWLSDRERQDRTERAIKAFAQAWRRGPTQQRFALAAAALPERSAEALAEAVRALFADDDWIGTAIDGLAAKLGADPFFAPPLPHLNSDVHSGLIVFEDEAMSITVSVASAVQLAAKKTAKRGPTSIGFTGRVSVLKFVKAGGARLSLWEAPPITADFAAASAGRCRCVEERDLVDGEILVVDGRRQGYVIEQVRTNFVVVQAEIRLDQAPLSVEYDSASLGYVGCSATDDGASRIQMMTTLLRKLGCAEAFEPIAALLDHPDFFVRWHVMKELLGIDAEAAFPHLKRMAARDPHPDVRKSARAVLDRFDAARPSKAA
jgi:HEAT repeat protein